MNFSDVIEKIFVEDFFNTMSFPKIIICFGITLVIGLLIYVVYLFRNRTQLYSREFNVVLLVLPLITSAIVMAMQASIALSLGMLGALSIVRFRNAVKSSIDLLFLFWSISIGIICGGELYLLAITLSLVLSLVLLVTELHYPKNGTYLLVINCQNISLEKDILRLVSHYTKRYNVKSKSIHNGNMDLIIEIRSKYINELVRECSKIDDIENVNLLSHNGDVRI